MRTLFLLLLAANALFAGWSQGLFKAWGWAPVDAREPQRLAQQLHPQALQLVPASALPSAARAAPLPTAAPASAPPNTPDRASASPPDPASPPVCLQTLLRDDAQVRAVRQGLAALGEPTLSAPNWTLAPHTQAARWIVYMGRFDGEPTLARKRQELAGLSLQAEPVRSGALALGLSLGAHPSQAEAVVAMARLAQRGVRTARVVQEQPELRGQMLRLPHLDAPRRELLSPKWAEWGVTPPEPCPATPAPGPAAAAPAGAAVRPPPASR